VQLVGSAFKTAGCGRLHRRQEASSVLARRRPWTSTDSAVAVLVQQTARNHKPERVVSVMYRHHPMFRCEGAPPRWRRRVFPVPCRRLAGGGRVVEGFACGSQLQQYLVQLGQPTAKGGAFYVLAKGPRQLGGCKPWGIWFSILSFCFFRIPDFREANHGQTRN